MMNDEYLQRTNRAKISRLSGLFKIKYVQVQLFIVHRVRNSFKYIPFKDYRNFAAGLKTICQAADEQQTPADLERMEAEWGKKYAPALENWQRDWLRLIPMFQYGLKIRRLIYTTNTVEGLHRQLRKAAKTKGAITSEDALENSFT